jgi:hypothetical protein
VLLLQNFKPWLRGSSRIDHLQYLGGGGLLLQSLARLGDESGILHRDDRLRGKVLQQRYLLVGERPRLASVDGDDAEERTVLAQRHRQKRAPTAEIDEGARQRIARLIVVAIGHVGDMNNARTGDQATERRPVSGRWGALVRNST